MLITFTRPKNMFQQSSPILFVAMACTEAFEDPVWVEVPVVPPNGSDTPSFEKLPLLEAYELVSYLWDTGIIEVSAADVLAYWRHVRDKMQLAWALAHPASCHHIPLGVYGDEANYTDSLPIQKVIAIHLDCPLHRPSAGSAFSKFMLFCIRSSLSLGARTLEPVVRHITWSLNVCYFGAS